MGFCPIRARVVSYLYYIYLYISVLVMSLKDMNIYPYFSRLIAKYSLSRARKRRMVSVAFVFLAFLFPNVLFPFSGFGGTKRR